MNVPPEIRSKIRKLLKQFRIGEFAEQADLMKPEDRFVNEASIGTQYGDVEQDFEKNRINGVAILRPSSMNCNFKGGKGRRYSKLAQESVAKLITGKKAYIDHATETEMKERRGNRSMRDLLGFYENGRLDDKNIVRADLVYLDTHKNWFESIVKTMADKVGKSIHAYGPTFYDKATGEEVVEDVKVLRSADLVTETGSTINLFESKPTTEEEGELEIENLTLEELQEKNPGLIAGLLQGWKEEQDEDKTLETLKTQVASLQEEKKALVKEVDEFKLKDKVSDKEVKVLKLVEDSKIKKEYVSDAFMEQMRAAPDEEAMKKLIEDRQELIKKSGKTTGVTGMGDDRDLDESHEDDDGKGESEEKKKKLDEEMVAAVKAGENV